MNISEEKIAEIKNAADIVGVISEYIELKQAGKDYIGLCPFHTEKTASFTVSSGKQMYFCFGCSASGDVFKFLEIYKGLSFLDAARQLADRYGILIPETGAPVAHRSTPKPPKSSSQQPVVNSQKKYTSVPSSPPDLWQEKAGKLVGWAHDKLLHNPGQLEILAGRGIKPETVKRFRLGWNPGKDGKDLFRPRESWGLPTEMKDGRKKKLWLPIGLIIPMFIGDHVHRLRIRRPDGSKPSYYIIPGSSMSTWLMQKSDRVFTIVESELDGILLWQEARDVVGIIPLGSASTRPDPVVVKLLEQSALILNALDYDAAGTNAQIWWKKVFPQTRRWPVPGGKDPGEAWQAGIDLKEWITSGFPEGWRVGQSLFDSKKKAKNGSERSKNETGAEKEVLTQGVGEKVQPESTSGSPPADSQPALIPEVYKLEKLLKQYPVTILNTPKRVSVKEVRAWVGKNPEVSKEISNLVFMTPEVFNYICLHPAKVITGDNLILT